MSSQSTQPAKAAQPDSSPYLMDSFARLNALRHDHNALKKKYSSALAHIAALKLSGDTLNADFNALVAAYEDLSESDMARRVEVETLKQECDILKRRNNELEPRETNTGIGASKKSKTLPSP